MHHDVRWHEAESGHRSVEMCPLETERTHLSSSQRRGKQPNCHRKHTVRELFTHLTALEGSQGRSLGGSHQERVELCSERVELCSESGAWSWPFPFAMGRLGFPLIVFNACAITVQLITAFASYCPTLLPAPLLCTLKPPPIVPRNSPPSPVIFSSQDHLLAWFHHAYVRARDREGTQVPQSFVQTVGILQTH